MLETHNMSADKGAAQGASNMRLTCALIAMHHAHEGRDIADLRCSKLLGKAVVSSDRAQESNAAHVLLDLGRALAHKPLELICAHSGSAAIVQKFQASASLPFLLITSALHKVRHEE